MEETDQIWWEGGVSFPLAFSGGGVALRRTRTTANVAHMQTLQLTTPRRRSTRPYSPPEAVPSHRVHT